MLKIDRNIVPQTFINYSKQSLYSMHVFIFVISNYAKISRNIVPQPIST